MFKFFLDVRNMDAVSVRFKQCIQ